MNDRYDDPRMNCTKPIDGAILADYWIAGLPGSDEAVIEEHLLQCDSCGERLRDVIALAEGIRDLAREGSLRMVVSETFLKRSENNGARIRQYAPPLGGSVQCTVTAEDDFLIGRLAADLSDATRVDLCLCDGSGIEQHRLRDIPVHSAASSVIYQESITVAKALPTTKLIMRLVAFDEAGSERAVGEYVFNHTRTLPA